METRDIINASGDVVGQLSLPDGTSEAVWSTALSAYTIVPPIRSVTPRQIRQALILSGISIATIDAALDTLPEPMRSLAHVEWEYSVAFERDRPLVVQMAGVLGLSSDQADALWKLAATL